MFFGLPVAAFDLHETRVSAGDAGAYAEANSDEALAGLIGALLDDPARRTAMGEAGRARVREQLAWDHSVGPLLAAYDQAFSGYRSEAPPRRRVAASDPAVPEHAE